VQWIDIDSTVDSVCGTQEGAAKGYNPNPSSRDFSLSKSLIFRYSRFLFRKTPLKSMVIF
jgi:hypothetical protein